MWKPTFGNCLVRMASVACSVLWLAPVVAAAPMPPVAQGVTLYLPVRGQAGRSPIRLYGVDRHGAVTLQGTIGDDVPIGVAVDSKGNIYTANVGNDSVSIYAPGANGTFEQAGVLAGPATGIFDTWAVAFDLKGRLYVANGTADSISVFRPGSTGNATPLFTIRGPQAGLDTPPTAVAVDASGNIYAVSDRGPLIAYRAGLSGNVRPSASISFSGLGLQHASGVAADSHGRIYIPDFAGYKLWAFAPLFAPVGGSLGKPQPPVSLDIGWVEPTGVACDNRDNLWIGEREIGLIGEREIGAVAEYPAGSTGNASPITLIEGPDTGLAGQTGRVVVDSKGKIYATNWWGGPNFSGSVMVYAAGSDGNAAPIATINTPSSGLGRVTGISVDAAGDLYVANLTVNGTDLLGGVKVYARGSAGPVAPKSSIDTGDAAGIAMDGLGRTFVLLASGDQLRVYAAGASGAAAPIATVKLGFRISDGAFAADSSGNIYVADPTHPAIDIYALDSASGATLARMITGSHTGLAYTSNLALDSHDNLWVSNPAVSTGQKDSIAEYAPGADGDARPIATISGARTKLASPGRIVIDASGNIYVANNYPGPEFISIFAPRSNGNLPPAAVVSEGGAIEGDFGQLAVFPPALP